MEVEANRTCPPKSVLSRTAVTTASRTDEPRAAWDARDAENDGDDAFKALADSLENILENTLWQGASPAGKCNPSRHVSRGKNRGPITPLTFRPGTVPSAYLSAQFSTTRTGRRRTLEDFKQRRIPKGNMYIRYQTEPRNIDTLLDRNRRHTSTEQRLQ